MEQRQSERSPRERVLEAADALFNARAVHAVKLNEIIAQARVSATRIYVDFDGKDAIVAAVLERRHVLWGGRLRAAVERETAPRDQLLAIFDFLEEWFAEDDFAGCCFINAFGELGRTSPQVAELARQHKQWFVDYVGDLAVRGGLSGSAAAGVVLLAEGAQVSAAILRSPEPARNARLTAEMILAANDQPIHA